MAWYHVGGCSCPIGDCDCGLTDKDRAQDKLVSEMREFLNPLEFTAIFKDIINDGRKDVVKSCSYLNKYGSSEWKRAFKRYVNEPSIDKVLIAGHKTHWKFHTRDYYSPKLLRR